MCQPLSQSFTFDQMKMASNNPTLSFPSPPSDPGYEFDFDILPNQTSSSSFGGININNNNIHQNDHVSSPDTSISSGLLEDTFAWDFDLSSLPLPSNFNNNNKIVVGSERGIIGEDLGLKDSFEVSPVLTAPTPTSTTIISPKSSISSFIDVGAPLIPWLSNNNNNNIVGGGGNNSTGIDCGNGIQSSDADTAEALSNHHLQRYLHYKNLAAQAEAEAKVKASLALQQQQQQEHQQRQQQQQQSINSAGAGDINTFEALLAAYSLPMSDNKLQSQQNINMIAVHQNQPQQQSYNQQHQPMAVPSYINYDPQQQASMAHAQAQAHLQAHDLALARAQQQRMQSQIENTGYWVDTTQSAFAVQPPIPPQPQQQQQQQLSVTYDRKSISAQSASPSFPSTPNYQLPVVPPMVQSMTAPLPVSTSAVSSLPIPATHSPEGEDEMEEEIDDDENNNNDHQSPSSGTGLSGSLSPESGDSGSGSGSIINIHGGGRGYIPGQTPDDPKKKHKCSVCGRGFARAFNLKSHVQTHNPVRSKPYTCPHSSCKRGFSRLHDLERHRQGIHSDGPLVEAKKKGLTPSVVRAQSRILKNVENDLNNVQYK